MKKLLVIALMIAMLLNITACGAKKNTAKTEIPDSIAEKEAEENDMPDEEVSEEENNMQIANPFITYDSMDDAAADAGFSMNVPENVEGFNEKLIQVMSHEMIQVIYYNEEASLYARKAKGSDDISGDYNEYSQTESVTVNGNDVVMKGNDGDFRLAMWTADGYTYAVMTDYPMTVEAFSAVVAEIN